MSGLMSSLADFYRRRLRQFPLVRWPKLAVWTAIWFIRWKLLFPLLHPSGALAWFLRWRVYWPARRAISRAWWLVRWRLLYPLTNRWVPRATWIVRWRLSWPLRVALAALNWFLRWRIVQGLVRILVLKPAWFVRWRILRPFALAVLPPSALRAFHRMSGAGISGLWGRSRVPALPLLPQSQLFQGCAEAAVLEVFPACRVESPRPAVLPQSLARTVGALPEEFTFPAVVVSELRDVQVIGLSNMLVLPDGVVHHDLYRFSHDYTSEELHGRIRIYPGRNEVRRQQPSGVGPDLEAAAAFTDSCAPNYAHWLTEVLPRIHAYAVAARRGGKVIIDAGLHRNLVASAQLMLGPGVELVELPPGVAARVERLQVVSPAGYIPFDRRPGSWEGHSHGRFSAPALRSMRAHLDRLLGVSAAVTPTRILLRRSSVGRALKNEQQVEDALTAIGFVPVYPERLTFEEQYRLFSRAEVVVGATGAAFANLLFCPADARLIICLSAHPHHVFGYWQAMAAAVGNRVTYVLGKITGARSAGVHADFEIEVGAVLQAVEAACG
jgi:capsular polysaccharide biosynthesis protein